MKKLYTLFVLLFAFSTANSQIVNIPDANFKAKLLAASSNNQVASTTNSFSTTGIPLSSNEFNNIDTNNDGQIQVSEASVITYLDISNSEISSLIGLEAFTNLKSFNCNNNSITTLQLSNSTLLFLYCSYNELLLQLNLSSCSSLVFLDCEVNQLNNLDLTQNSNLAFLNCSGNQINNLDLSQNNNLANLNCFANQLNNLNLTQNINLIYLNCSGNQLNNLDLSQNTLLSTLVCSQNNILNLNITQNYNLTYLDCYDNQLTSLDISQNTDLVLLDCSYNQLTSLNLSQNIELIELKCFYNLLTSLDLSQNFNLETLVCFNNQITTINSNQQNSVLTYIDCNFNQISSIDLTQNLLLNTLYISNNLITNLDLSMNINLSSLDISFNSQLENLLVKNNSFNYILSMSECNNLQYICCDDYEVQYFQNSLDEYVITNCHVNTYCSFVPGGTIYTIQGNTKFDSNNNGCEVNDINIPHQNFAISNGINNDTVFANNSGFYSIPVQAGTHTLTPVFENPSFFNISPTNLTVSFQNQMGPFTQDFCITANGNHNDLEVTLLPIGAARPGFDSQYKIIYKNKGTQSQSGSVNLTFNDTVLDLVSSNPTANSQTTNNLTWNFSNLLPFETREIGVTFNVNSPTETPAVNDGDVLNYTATVIGTTDETPIDNSSTLNQTVVNSYDPNDKTCVEGTSITPSMVGQYVHYVIRFENTGTFPAENIVVADVIDSAKFDLTTLIPQSSSHNFVTRINNTTNKVEFIFENINLPFDDANNDGYVAFKIKTKPTLVLGDTFSNGANIYFDYNFPITTNTYVTTVQSLGNQDFEFNSVFSLSPVPTKDVLTITAKDSVVMTSVSIYNTLGQLVQVNTNPSETIDVSELSSGSYFIKIISDRGSATGKFIKE